MEDILNTTKRNVIAEASDPSRIDYPAFSKKFKGVVLQRNGHWGAQIYGNHQRIWLGTFKSEKDAAMAYDSAAIKLRNGDSHRNFPWTNITVHEPNFQSYYSTEAILNMIKDGSYVYKFADFLRSRMVEKELGLNLAGFCCKLLFQKQLTPSDVGTLNRLVIPKKYAVKCFPHPENMGENTNVDVDDLQLVFYDRLFTVWKFRYCYWKSSQSFVFTRGWNRFVKEKQVKANDIVAFYICEGREWENKGHTFCIIDVVYKGVSSNDGIIQGINQNVRLELDLCLRLGRNFNCITVKEEQRDFDRDLGPAPNMEKKGVRLFGVQVI
uniref:AP2/ERF transcription factor n=1 Tax=Camptotheca acuminata TaxID=16922 RepID=A0A7G8AUB0_CAMAC|nr:AP2/ERF transcription factor [Camptotheca acuminata]